MTAAPGPVISHLSRSVISQIIFTRFYRLAATAWLPWLVDISISCQTDINPVSHSPPVCSYFAKFIVWAQHRLTSHSIISCQSVNFLNCLPTLSSHWSSPHLSLNTGPWLVPLAWPPFLSSSVSRNDTTCCFKSAWKWANKIRARQELSHKYLEPRHTCQHLVPAWYVKWGVWRYLVCSGLSELQVRTLKHFSSN